MAGVLDFPKISPKPHIGENRLIKRTQDLSLQPIMHVGIMGTYRENTKHDFELMFNRTSERVLNDEEF